MKNMRGKRQPILFVATVVTVSVVVFLLKCLLVHLSKMPGRQENVTARIMIE